MFESILRRDEEKQQSMLKDLNELICVRGTPVTMRRGLPFDLNPVSSAFMTFLLY